MILLIDNYDSFTYNLYQCIEILGFRCQVARNDSLSLDQIRQLNPSGIVISPGPGEPSSAGISLQVIEKLSSEFPILGVCLGHQAIGQAFGAKVVRAKQAVHGKVDKISHNGKGLYKGLSQPFLAARYHSLVIERDTIPSCLEITSESQDQNIMGIRHKTLPIVGVQFHPESIATDQGPRLVENFLKGNLS